ncbi:hypothetical protein, partial [Thauera sinica]
NTGGNARALLAMQQTNLNVQHTVAKIQRAEDAAREFTLWQQGNCQNLSANQCAAKLQSQKELISSVLLDFTPILSDLKAFAEANTLGDYSLAVLGAVSGSLGSLARALKSAEKTNDVVAAGSKVGMLGENGVQTASKTLWKGNGKERIDVENPNPGQRPGQIHYQDNKGNKYLYDPATDSFPDAPKVVNEMLENSLFRQAIDKGMKKYLGE